MAPKIALFGGKDDAQINEIAAAVVAENGRPLVFDIQVGGDRENSLVTSNDGGSWNGTDFSVIRSLHIRCTAPRTLPAVPPVLNAASHSGYRTRFLEEQEFQAATYGFFESQVALGKLVVNPLTGAYVDHNSKSQFYEKLRTHGFPVPRTLSTNSPEIARRFIDDRGEVVVKPAIGIGSTRLVTKADIGRLRELRWCPAVFQECLHGQTVRVHIVGDSVVLALRVISDGGIDSRSGKQAFDPVELSDEDKASIVRANRLLGLHYAAWDVILGEDDRITWLDCNPGPALMWITADFRRRVFHPLATYLVAFAETGSLDEASERVRTWQAARPWKAEKGKKRFRRRSRDRL